MKQTKVVFRTFKDDGSLIALFPYDIVNQYGDCNSFKTIGPHGPADYLLVMSKSIRSTPHQIETMKASLKLAGYTDIVEVKRINAKESQKANEEFRLKR